jgi:predicted transcriptional regulator
MIKRSLDVAIERRESCRSEPIRKYLTTDHVMVADEYSDTQLAEIFLHHRVLVVPIAKAGRIESVVTRSDFFAELVQKFQAASG